MRRFSTGYDKYGVPPQSVYAPPVAGPGYPSVPMSSGYPSGPGLGLAPPPDADPQYVAHDRSIQVMTDGDESRLWNWFHGVNTDRSGAITVVELRE